MTVVVLVGFTSYRRSYDKMKADGICGWRWFLSLRGEQAVESIIRCFKKRGSDLGGELGIDMTQ